MRVNEIFWSIQGEGARSGLPSIFLRLTGCTLQCPYCDSRQAWAEGTRMTVKRILAEIAGLKASYPDSQVVITGGEPLEQDLGELVAGLRQGGYFIAIETNGIYSQDLALEWWTLSPKDVSEFYIAGDLKKKINEVKLIVNRNLDTGVIEKIREIGNDFPIFLQPDGYDRYRYRRSFALFKACQSRGIRNVRLGVQMHRIFGIK
jgi:7-carboxy-7-deazaguanine synthase